MAILGEFKGFAEAISTGKKDPNGDPTAALADLAAVEYMLKSGDNGGKPFAYNY